MNGFPANLRMNSFMFHLRRCYYECFHMHGFDALSEQFDKFSNLCEVAISNDKLKTRENNFYKSRAILQK